MQYNSSNNTTNTLNSVNQEERNRAGKWSKSKWEQIFVHDIEAAAFIIVSVMLAASVTSYALDVNRSTKNLKQDTANSIIINSIYRDPETISLQDINGDGINDIVIVHKSGQREVIMTTN